MRTVKYIILCLSAVFAVSCTDIVNDLASLHLDVENLKAQVEMVNSSIESLDEVVSSISVHYITEVKEMFDEDGVRIGYSLFYDDGRVVDLMFGKDGSNGRNGRDGLDGRNGFDGWDGKMPKMGVSQDSDGMWYWTADGEWLLDPEGRKLLANGTGRTPRMKVENDSWYYSIDGGGSWIYLCPATAGYYTLFESIDYKSSYEYVILTLTNGSVLQLPRYIDVTVNFTPQAEQSILYSEPVRLEYSVMGGNGDVSVEVVCSEGLDFTLVPATASSGSILISSEMEFVSGQVLIFVRRNSRTFMKNYRFAVKYQGLSQNGTANCYLVNRAGTYRFFAGVKGNSFEPLDGVPEKAIVLWESLGESSAPSVGSVIRNVGFRDGYVEFTTDLTREGNAVIAVQDEENNILWSWHIWAAKFYPESDYCVFESHPDIRIMGRNLGALSSAVNDMKASGLYYQCGRKDPFLGAASYEDWQASVKSTAVWPAPVVNSSLTGNLAYSVLHPMTFISGSDNYRGWDCYEDSKWTSDKSATDPCPPGWKVVPYDSDWYEIRDCSIYDYEKHICRVPAPYSVPECILPLSGGLNCNSYDLSVNTMWKGSEPALWVAGYDSNDENCFMFNGMSRGGGRVTAKSDACSIRCCSEK